MFNDFCYLLLIHFIQFSNAYYTSISTARSMFKKKSQAIEKTIHATINILTQVYRMSAKIAQNTLRNLFR